jgi:hypothetical protein
MSLDGIHVDLPVLHDQVEVGLGVADEVMTACNPLNLPTFSMGILIL